MPAAAPAPPHGYAWQQRLALRPLPHGYKALRPTGCLRPPTGRARASPLSGVMAQLLALRG